MQTDTEITVLLCLMGVILISAIILFLVANRVGRIEKEKQTEKRCPYCAELIKKDATICRFCGRDLPVPDLLPQPTVIEKVKVESPQKEPSQIPEPVKQQFFVQEPPKEYVAQVSISEPVAQPPSQPTTAQETKLQSLKPQSSKRTKAVGVAAIVVTLIFCVGFGVVALSLLGLNTQPTISQEDALSTILAQVEAANTANPDGHLHEIMKKQGVTLTAKEVQYDMANKLDKKFGLSGIAEICDYYNWGYDDSIKDKFFCVEVTPSGGYLERWYIYFSRTYAPELYQDLLEGNVQIFLIAEIQSNLYDENQENMATGYYVEWVK